MTHPSRSSGVCPNCIQCTVRLAETLAEIRSRASVRGSPWSLGGVFSRRGGREREREKKRNPIRAQNESCGAYLFVGAHLADPRRACGLGRVLDRKMLSWNQAGDLAAEARGSRGRFVIRRYHPFPFCLFQDAVAAEERYAERGASDGPCTGDGSILIAPRRRAWRDRLRIIARAQSPTPGSSCP